MDVARDADGHFTRIATRYDEMCRFMYEPTAKLAVKYLQLEPDDLLGDVGGGTGEISHLVWKTAGLKAPVLCVDPNAEMLREAEKWEGVKPYHGSADDFFSSNLQPKCNKILISGTVHYFPDPLTTFRKAALYLPADGIMLIRNRSGEATLLPLWKSAVEKIGKGYDSSIPLQTVLEQAGFSVQVITYTYTAEMTKGEWYDKIRQRMFHVLNGFSDEQIEEGLKELDRDWFPAKKDSDVVQVDDKWICCVATKT